MARLLLLRVHEQPELRSDDRKSDLRANTVGQEFPGAVQVGQRKYYRTRAICQRDNITTSDASLVLGSNRLPVDRRNNGAAEDRGLDTQYREARGRVLPDSR